MVEGDPSVYPTGKNPVGTGSQGAEGGIKAALCRKES